MRPAITKRFDSVADEPEGWTVTACERPSFKWTRLGEIRTIKAFRKIVPVAATALTLGAAAHATTIVEIAIL